MVATWVRTLCLWFKVRRVHPLRRHQIWSDKEHIETTGTNLEIELAVTSEGGMFKGLDDGHIRVLQVGILADESDCHLIEQPFLSRTELSEWNIER